MLIPPIERHERRRDYRQVGPPQLETTRLGKPRGLFSVVKIANHIRSTSNPPVLPPEMVFTKVWSGSRHLSARLVISRFGISFLDGRSCPQDSKTIETSLHLFLSINSLVLLHESFSSLQSHCNGRRKGGYCTMSLGYCVYSSLAFASRHLV